MDERQLKYEANLLIPRPSQSAVRCLCFNCNGLWKNKRTKYKHEHDMMVAANVGVPNIFDPVVDLPDGMEVIRSFLSS